jgi:hypothetical protein
MKTRTNAGTSIPKSTPLSKGLGKESHSGIAVPVSQNGASVELAVITPERAHELLHSNHYNRHIRQIVVERYAATMRAAAWTLSPDAVAISEDGTLYNGQHRLSAIVETGLSQRLIVLRGLHLEDKINIDRGTKRSLADYLQMERAESYATLLASVLNVVWKWDFIGAKFAASAQSARGSAEINELLKFFDAAPDDFRDTVSRAEQWRNIPLRSSLTLGAFHVFKRIDLEEAERFFGTFDSGAMLSEGDPLMVLRNQLFMVRSRAEKIAAATQLAWVIKAWNAVRRGQRPQKFQLQEKTFPEPA